MRTRLRPAHSPARLREIYATPHSHDHWIDHKVRVQVTLGVAAMYEDVSTAADLSCGDGWILKHVKARTKYFGDFAPKYDIEGPIEKTIDSIPDVDLFILSETLEHVDDPELVLTKIRAKTRHLVLSTPSNETDPNLNIEHYWGWDEKEIEDMLVKTGFKPDVFNHLMFPNLVYNFQVWGAS